MTTKTYSAFLPLDTLRAVLTAMGFEPPVMSESASGTHALAVPLPERMALVSLHVTGETYRMEGR